VVFVPFFIMEVDEGLGVLGEEIDVDERSLSLD